MKIALIIDKENSAIARLSREIITNLPHFEFRLVPFHPKRPDIDQITYAREAFKWCDIWHVGYWKSGEAVKQYLDAGELARKPKLLCHYNPYDIHNDCNKDYQHIVVGNSTIRNELPVGRLINYGVDLDFWKFPTERKENAKPTICMVVARIEGKKGVKPVAQACKELGYRFILVGRVSSGDYFQQIMEANPETIFREDILDEELKQVYWESDLHICNSIDNFESGTMPMLEAMACGCPVLTRNVGHVPDLFSEDAQNMGIYPGDPEDVESLKASMKELIDNPLLLSKMREKGWQTVKNWGSNRMAWKFEKLYWDIMGNGEPVVSVIAPIRNEYELLPEYIKKVGMQSYKNIELVIVDSSDIKIDVFRIINRMRELNIPVPDIIKYIPFEYKGYSLAKARNLGVLNAVGQLIVFCDIRIGMEPGAVKAFADRWEPNHWMWGMKDDAEKGFVENFSCVGRQEFVYLGMFNESICDTYGCMTQEIRERITNSKVSMTLRHIPQAKAYALKKSSNASSKRDEIRKSKDKLFKLYNA